MHLKAAQAACDLSTPIRCGRNIPCAATIIRLRHQFRAKTEDPILSLQETANKPCYESLVPYSVSRRFSPISAVSRIRETQNIITDFGSPRLAPGSYTWPHVTRPISVHWWLSPFSGDGIIVNTIFLHLREKT
jgi:hypothetical protein